jgi:transcriptional regulator with XRE-family HTH domain
MNSKAEKRAAAAPVTETPLPEDIAALFANTHQATSAELVGLVKAVDALRADAGFLADYSKGLIVEDILRAMESAGLNRNTLATKLGKSRQYIGKILDEDHRANFTIDTLAELSAILGLQLQVRLLPPNEDMVFLRRNTVKTQVKPSSCFPELRAKPIAHRRDFARFEPRPNIQPARHDRACLST